MASPAGRGRASHSGLVHPATSGLGGQDLQTSGTGFLSVLSWHRERPGVGWQRLIAWGRNWTKHVVF